MSRSSAEAVDAVARRAIRAVAIGASAGGFEAILAVVKDLPASFPVPLVAVLHLPDHHESRLAELFGYRLALQVR